MSLPTSDLEELTLKDTAVKDSTSVPDVAADNFLVGYENPAAWFKKYNVQRDDFYDDIMSDNLIMKKVMLKEYNQNMPEWVKWEQFGSNLFICYEYTCKGETKNALEIISDIENILTSIGINDPFLNSIKIALNHVTFSFKCHLLQLCSIETTALLKSFAMPNEMDQVNKAALFGIQSLFFYEYGVPCAQIAIDSALKAISLNEREAEWHFLRSHMYLDWQITDSSLFLVSKHQIDAAEKAVELGNKDRCKLYLAYLYERMSRNYATNAETKKHFVDAGLTLVKEVIMNGTNDYMILKHCLRRLSRIDYGKSSDETNDMLEKLVDKLKSSDNPYVHAAIGNYYLYKKEDYEKANFYLKKSIEVKSFGNTLDYVCTFYKIDPNTTQVEPLFVEMLKAFPHPTYVVKILVHFISYLIVIKSDLIEALKYIPQLLDFKHDTDVYIIQHHRMKFVSSNDSINLINMLTEKLNGALKDNTLPTDHIERATEVLQMLESYKKYVSCLMQEKKLTFGNKPFARNKKEFLGHKNPKQDSISVKSKDEGNWRLLKPDSMTNPNIFSRNHHK